MNVSGKSVEEASEQLTSTLQAYTLTLKERGNKNDKISAAEIGLKYSPEEQLKNFKKKQNPLTWISTFFATINSKKTIGATFDEKLLKERVNSLSCFDQSNVIEPKNPSFRYKDSSYVIVNEVNGKKVNRDILYEHIANAILKKESSIDLELIGCYVKPQYNSTSPKITETKDMLNKYVSSKITYTFGESKEVLDGSTINKWLTVDKNFNITLNKEKVKKYIDTLSTNYSTVGKTRSFITSSGKSLKIDGGDYGWSINKAKEAQDLYVSIQQGQTITKKPSYQQTALSHENNDIGNTYVEIDLTKQHLWFYKNGSLLTEGDVVTGNVSSNHTTPAGIYSLKYKQRNTILRGPGYASPVAYWMPFNGGIGMHDASWRSEFGEEIYKINGSHGCINAPYELAKAIFENIDVNTPIICYNSN